MKIKEILEATNGKLVIGNEEDEVGNFCKDTRILNPGETYIGIKGANFDGSALWKEAFETGAKTVIVQDINFVDGNEKLDQYDENNINEKNISNLKNNINKKNVNLENSLSGRNADNLENVDKNIDDFKNKNVILVDDTKKAIADIARYKRNLYDIPVIGITGSVGKTSTKDIVANVISQKYKTLKTEGNNNNDIGLPFTIFRLNGHEAAVIEMGMNHFGEISNLTKIAQPTIAVITNIGTSHIGNLGSRENILKAKLEILEGMKKKILVINNDNDLLHDFYIKNKENNDLEIHTYGIENESEFMAQNIVLNENYSEFDCNLKNAQLKVKVPVGGKHFIYNALCAITVGKLLNLSDGDITKGIGTFELTKKRMEITKLSNGVTIINDSYNASFEAMEAAIEYLGSINANRKIAVLGDMFEQGDYSVQLHKEVGDKVAEDNIDVLVACGKNAKYIADETILSGMDREKVFYFEEKNMMKNFIRDNWKEGDCILFKAANGMKFFEVVEELVNSK